MTNVFLISSSTAEVSVKREQLAIQRLLLVIFRTHVKKVSIAPIIRNLIFKFGENKSQVDEKNDPSDHVSWSDRVY